MTRQIQVGQVPVGGGAPVSIQSMLNTRTTDVEGCLAQIKALAAAGCQIARLAIPDMEAAQAFVDENDIQFSLAFGPILVDNGVRCEPDMYYLGEINDKYPRVALCHSSGRPVRSGAGRPCISGLCRHPV